MVNIPLKKYVGGVWEKLFPSMDDFNGLAGEGRTTETVKGNAAAIAAHWAEFAPTVTYPTAGGSANAITIAQSGFTKTDGRKAYFKAKYTNTGNVTANVNSTGASSVRNIDGNQLAAGDIEKDNYYEIVWDATQNFFVLRPRGAKLDGIISAIEAWGGTVAAPQKADDVVTAIEDVASWDENFTAGNLREGITALGITGTLVPTPLSAGNFVILNSSSQKSTTSTDYVKLKEITAGAAFPSIRVSFDMTNSGGTYGRAVIYKNDVLIGTVRKTNSSSFVTFTEDITDIASGDKIQLYAKTTYNESVRVRNFQIKTVTLATVTYGD